VPHGVVLLGVLFAGEPLTTDTAGERARLDVGAPVDVQTAALSELLAAGFTGKRLVAGVRPFVRRQVGRAGERATAPGADVHRGAPARVAGVHVRAQVRRVAERLAAAVTHERWNAAAAANTDTQLINVICTTTHTTRV